MINDYYHSNPMTMLMRLFLAQVMLEVVERLVLKSGSFCLINPT